jgi:hypothetical protein
MTFAKGASFETAPGRPGRGLGYRSSVKCRGSPLGARTKVGAILEKEYRTW